MRVSTSTKIRGRGNRLLRAADRYAGIPVIALLSTLPKKKSLPQRIDRIGILTTAAIGDTILIGAVVSDLHSAFPASSIIFFASESNYEAAALLPAPDFVIRLPIYRPIRAARIVRKWRLDLLIDFGPWPRINAVIAKLSRARFIAGFRTPGQYRHYGYDLAIDHSPDLHELENHRRMIRWLGVTPTHLPVIDSRKIPVNLYITISHPYLVFHPWPGGRRSREKEWPLERWIQLVAHFAARGYGIALTGAPGQRLANEEMIRAIDIKYHSMIRNAAGMNLAETAALLMQSLLVVSVDTGIKHLAAALQVPLIALQGPASSRRWGPVGGNAIAIDTPDPHGGYLYLGFEMPAKTARCMEAISYETVLSECLKKLVQPKSGVSVDANLGRPG
jgi:ADP-heptose:LPS heptosyltransferase